MLELKVFQSDSARLMAERYAYFAKHPDRPRKGSKPRAFFQALSALTGAGKTPILAQAVALMRSHFSCEPIVFWMSKARSVVAQTYTNFSAGGKYSEILDGFKVITVSDLRPELITDGTCPLLVMATTGLFNNRDQSEGALNIYKKDHDLFGDQSPWERLIQRKFEGKRRPLVIVYDEGHNLSEQQTALLAELEPEAYLLASATLKLPASFQQSVIQHIKSWLDESSDAAPFAALNSVDDSGAPDAGLFVTTKVSSEKVVASELVKKAIQFDGTTAPMEQCLDDLIKRLKTLDTEIKSRGLGFKPKAIYVCRTNITSDGDKDDPTKPFQVRNAPPIRIWRYLVETKGIKPKDIAIYADLKFVDGNKPDQVNLFSNGENDFDDFQAQDFQHIIFNLALQEGWDDPACYLAYIDKSMGSSIQVQQVIGRVLRQYGAQHYENPLLNSAHFFLRVDKESVFTTALDEVRQKLADEGAPIEITANFSTKGAAADELFPREGVSVPLHHIFVDSDSAREKIAEIISEFPSFAEGDPNTIGEAHRASQIVDLVPSDKGVEAVDWVVGGQTNPVRLRWLVSTAVRSRSARAGAIIDLSESKFDVRVQVGSKANKLAEKLAQTIVAAFYQLSDLAYESVEPFKFGALRVPKTAPAFSNGLYQRYGGMNKFEKLFAESLDESGETWHRNPSAGGFYIPLLSEGDTANFYPDFLVWKKNAVYCLDTKGSHLLNEAVARKLFDVQEDGKTKVLVRFISEGQQKELRGKATKDGYTVWRMKSGSPTPIHVSDLSKAVAECLK